jgi:hypothetical protein
VESVAVNGQGSEGASRTEENDLGVHSDDAEDEAIRDTDSGRKIAD